MIEKKSPLGTIVDQNVYVGRDSLDNKLTTRKEVKNLIEDIAAHTYNGPTYTLLGSTTINTTCSFSNSLSSYDEIEIRLRVIAATYNGQNGNDLWTDYAYAYDIKSICSTSLTYSKPPIGPSNFYYHTYRNGIQAIAKTDTGIETRVTVYKNNYAGTEIAFVFSGSGTCWAYGKKW